MVDPVGGAGELAVGLPLDGDHLGFDAVVLIDGGNDSLMCGTELASRGAWRGACALTPTDPGVEAMCAAIEVANRAQQYPSTVANAVVAAVDGRFGHLETGSRGGGDSSVWVNPLMAMYWAFDLDAVVDRLAYAAALEGTVTSRDAIHNIIQWRRTITPAAPNRIPL